jgi:hypothetical protein
MDQPTGQARFHFSWSARGEQEQQRRALIEPCAFSWSGSPRAALLGGRSSYPVPHTEFGSRCSRGETGPQPAENVAKTSSPAHPHALSSPTHARPSRSVHAASMNHVGTSGSTGGLPLCSCVPVTMPGSSLPVLPVRRSFQHSVPN